MSLLFSVFREFHGILSSYGFRVPPLISSSLVYRFICFSYGYCEQAVFCIFGSTIDLTLILIITRRFTEAGSKQEHRNTQTD